MSYESLDNLMKQADGFAKRIAGLRPLANSELEQLRQYYRVGLTYSSNAIEGNSLTLTETKVVIEDGLTVAGKPLRDHLEAIGHAEAFDQIYRTASASSPIGEDVIKSLHRTFYRAIDQDNAGSYRTVKVIISGTNFLPPPPEKVPKDMEKLGREIPEIEKKHPITAAADIHAKFVNIHPFVDGNGRVARLLMNLVLIRHGLPIAVIPPIRKAEYISAVMTTNKGSLDPLRKIVATAVVESCKDYLRIFGEKNRGKIPFPRKI